MPRLLAPSISITSMACPEVISRQAVHSLQGSSEVPCSQLSALARIRAMEVLPTPRGPVKRYAWAARPVLRALERVRETWPCPVTSSNRCGRYLSANTR